MSENEKMPANENEPDDNALTDDSLEGANGGYYTDGFSVYNLPVTPEEMEPFIAESKRLASLLSN